MARKSDSEGPPSSTLVRVGAQGRIVLPAAVREEARLRKGDRLVLVATDDGLLLLTPEQAVRRVQRKARELLPPGRDLVRELLAERRAERRREARGG